MQQQLSKPIFTKLQSLLDGKNGFNVYAKVIKVEQKQSKEGGLKLANVQLADETGEALNHIKQKAVIAIRNGKMNIIKNHISVEIDMFGRVTPENIEIKQNLENKFSEKQISRPTKRPRRQDERRPPRRQNQRERKQNDRKPRQWNEKNGWQNNRKQNDREEEHDKKPRGNRNQDYDRKPRGNRNQDYNRKPKDYKTEDYERKPRQHDRKPARHEYDERPKHRDHRGGKTNWSKIGIIQPGNDNLNLFAKVVDAKSVGNKVRLLLGDETGVVQAFMFNNECIQEGETLVIFKAEAKVIKEHIELQLMETGKVDTARHSIDKVDKQNNISKAEWVQE